MNLADAEGDLYEWFADGAEFHPTTRAQWIVRAAQDRRMVAEETKKLWETMERAPRLGEVAVEVKARPNRPARLAHVAIRATRVVLRPPARTGYRLPEVAIDAVLAREENPPSGVQALEWLLLTSLPVGTFEQAATVVAWYAVRWSIKVYFYVLKQGCRIKRLQLETEERLLPCVALYMVIAWRVYPDARA